MRTKAFKLLEVLVVLVLTLMSCRTVDIERNMAEDMADENKTLKKDLESAQKALELRTKEDLYTYDIEPVVINTREYVVINENEFKEKERKTGEDAVADSLKSSYVTLEDYVGGTSYFDYDKDRQFPIFTKLLALTTIMLGDDEITDTESQIFMSDTTRWEVTGKVWDTDEGQRQLIFVKPTAEGLSANMCIVTDKRVYHIVLYSTNKNYQPMVQFRYPTEKEYITAMTKHSKPVKVKTEYSALDPDLVSWNYKITVPLFQKKIDWVPETVYDDGRHTYILLPDIVLNKEMPGVWEGSNEITNYEFDPEKHNLIIINKLIETVTLRCGRQKVVITKKKGYPVDFGR